MMLRVSHLSGFNAFRHIEEVAAPGALGLLDGETDGFAIDATSYDSITAAVFTGGPVGGTVAVINTGDPTDDLSNVALDSSNLVNSGTSPKMVHFPSSPYARWSPHNMLLRSQDFSATWTDIGTPVKTANTLEDNSAAAFEGVNQNITVVTGFVYTVSFRILKDAITSRFPEFQVFSSSGGNTINVDVNTSTGAKVDRAATNGSSVISDGGTHWILSCTILTSSTTLSVAIYPAVSGTIGTTDVATVGTTTVDGVWANRGALATPYLATTTAARVGIPQSYDTVGAKYGILTEPAATNLALYSDDFTNAAWTKSNMNTAKTATGPDAVANSASTLTATNSNATALQAITSGSAARITGFWVKRRTGSGNIDLTQDNGSTWQTMTVTADWTRVELTVATLANPTVGIRIVTNADAVDVFGFQHEVGSVLTSTIPTLGSTVTRAKDLITAPTSSFPFLYSDSTMYADGRHINQGGTTNHGYYHAIDAGTFANINVAYWAEDSDAFRLATLSTAGGGLSVTQGTALSSRDQITAAFKTNDAAITVNGAAISADTSGNVIATGTGTTYRIGNDPTPLTFGPTYFYRLVYVPRRVIDGDLPNWRYEA
jgi:hypothetical protein